MFLASQVLGFTASWNARQQSSEETELRAIGFHGPAKDHAFARLGCVSHHTAPRVSRHVCSGILNCDIAWGEFKVGDAEFPGVQL